MIAALALWLALPAHAGWADDVAAARATCVTDSTPCDVVDDLRIRESRAGLWFVQDDRLTPAMLPVLLERLERETAAPLRHALAHGVLQLLVDDDPTWHPAYVALASSDRQPEVRHTLLTGLRRAPRTVAEPAFRAALRHTDPQTRALAADMMGGHADAPVFVDALAEALTDADPTVRLEVVEALGKTRTAAALPLVQGIDPAGDDALQRTRARALERLTAIR